VIVVAQGCGATQGSEFDEEAEAGHHGSKPLDELNGGACGAASGEEVIDDEHTLAGTDGVGVYFEDGLSVFKRVRDGLDRGGQAALFADGHEPHPQEVGHRPTEDEPSCLDPRDGVDLLASERIGERVHRVVEKHRIAEDRRDVPEDDSLSREVGHGAHRRR
jgi:hypothetical protein